jgi:hypothetical protein
MFGLQEGHLRRPRLVRTLPSLGWCQAERLREELRPLRQRGALAKAHAAEDGTNRLRVQAVPGQPLPESVPIPLAQSPRPCLEPSVHQARVFAFSGNEVAAQALVQRASPLDYPRQVLLPHRTPPLRQCCPSNLSGPKQAGERDRLSRSRSTCARPGECRSPKRVRIFFQ